MPFFILGMFGEKSVSCFWSFTLRFSPGRILNFQLLFNLPQLRVFKYQQISRDMENMKECMHSQTYPGMGFMVFQENRLRSEGPDFVLKADINKLFLLCCVFSEIIKVYEMHGGKAHFSFYQVTKSNFLSFIKYCLKIMSFFFLSQIWICLSFTFHL